MVQELLRHATSKITTDVYQQGDEKAKRAAVGRLPRLSCFVSGPDFSRPQRAEKKLGFSPCVRARTLELFGSVGLI